MMGYCRCSVKAYFPPYTDLSMRVRVPHVRIIHVVHIASPVRETARCYKHGNWSFELNDKCERRYCTAYNSGSRSYMWKGERQTHDSTAG